MLKSSGIDSQLIKALLRDARLWGQLSKLLEGQIVALKSLQESYGNQNSTVLHEGRDETSNTIREFGEKRDNLAKQLHEKFKHLTSTSQELIQLVKQSTLALRIEAYMTIGI